MPSPDEPLSDSQERRGYPRRGGERQDSGFESRPSPAPRIEPLFIQTWRCPTCGADYHDPPGDPPICMFDHAELVPDAE